MACAQLRWVQAFVREHGAHKEMNMTKAQMAARIAELEAALAAKPRCSKAPATAAVVYVDGKPFFTAFMHSTAYRMMNTIKDRGHKAMYRPLGA